MRQIVGVVVLLALTGCAGTATTTTKAPRPYDPYALLVLPADEAVGTTEVTSAEISSAVDTPVVLPVTRMSLAAPASIEPAPADLVLVP
jgi:hypothetical protein